jgi:UDP-N-acetylglucosamine:LPS N-acetylglucosamine transferase
VLRDFRPDVIVSSGAGVALPYFVLGRLRGRLTVYVEVYDRIDSRTLTGRLCRPVSTLFCVQWEEQQQLYPGSIVVGPLL